MGESAVQKLLHRIEADVTGQVRDYATIKQLGLRIEFLEGRCAALGQRVHREAEEKRMWWRLLLSILDVYEDGSADMPAVLIRIGKVHDAVVAELTREGGRTLEQVLEVVRERKSGVAF